MRWVKAALVPAAAVVTWCACLAGIEFATHQLEMRVASTPWLTAAYALAFVFVPVFAGLAVVWAARSWWPWWPSLGFVRRPSRAIWTVVLAGYLLTAWVGAPMVQSDLTDMVIDQYREEQQIDKSGILPYHRELRDNPSCRTFLNAAVLPGVIVVYHEYQASGLNGAGAFYLFVWYGTGARYLTSYQRWVS